MGEVCHDGICSKCWACKYIVVGIILIANQMWLKWDIWVVLGALLVIKGVIKLVMPTCSHCAAPEAKKGKK